MLDVQLRFVGVDRKAGIQYAKSRAEQSRAEQSRAEQSRAEQSRAEQDNSAFLEYQLNRNMT